LSICRTAVGSAIGVSAAEFAGSKHSDAALARFTGVVQCETLVANSVVASNYTPGVGNIW